MFNIVQKRYLFFLLSALVVVPGLVSLVLFGVPRSIDFRGGALYEISFKEGTEVSEADLRSVYEEAGIGDVQVTQATDPDAGGLRYQIRSNEITAEEKASLTAALAERFGETPTELRFESVGPSVGAQVTRNASIAVAMAALGILLYLTLMFRNVPHPARYGVCAIVAMIHDVLVVVGLASIMGKLYGWEVDALFLTALLTVIGFSVHDSIVVFDRIRENVGRLRGLPYEQVVNHSIIQTLDRSINTQLTAVFTLTAILIYSQGQLQRFVFWLLVGIISGTYSSIFNAAPLLVVWENREWRRWFGRAGTEAAAA